MQLKNKRKRRTRRHHIHITINPNPTLTMMFHFHTCSSGNLNALPVNIGSAGSDCVGDGLWDVVVVSCVVPLAAVDVSTFEIEPFDATDEVLDIAVVGTE
jgi:hypothetical protein